MGGKVFSAPTLFRCLRTALGRRTCSGLVGYGVGFMALNTGSCLASRTMREEIFACERVLSRSGVRADPFRFRELWDFDSGADISEGHRILIRIRRTGQGA